MSWNENEQIGANVLKSEQEPSIKPKPGILTIVLRETPGTAVGRRS